jgi:DNA-binding GntR family transcriptional regulator
MSGDKRTKPRYLELAEEIGKGIEAGTFAVGTLLPSEAELCERHSVSRHTVREATRVLQELGLVARHQGLGTRIQAAKAASRYVLAMDAIPDLWEYVKNTELKVVRRKLVRAKDALTQLPGADPGDTWRLLEAIRYEKTGEPIAWKQVYIDARYDLVAGDVGKRTVPVYSLIEERYGVKTEKVRQEISAVAIPEEAARALEVEVGSSGLAIVRQYVGAADRVFEVTLSIYPANRFRYSVELKLEYGR